MPQGSETLGRFERWTQVMGGILQVCEVPGLLGNRKWVQNEADEDTRAWVGFCSVWYEQLGGHPVTAKDLFDVARERSLLLDLWGGRSPLAAQQRFGHALAARRDRVFGQFRICTAGRAPSGNAAYRLVPYKVEGCQTPETPETQSVSPATDLPSENGQGVLGVLGVCTEPQSVEAGHVSNNIQQPLPVVEPPMLPDGLEIPAEVIDLTEMIDYVD